MAWELESVISASRMAMANDSTNSMGRSGIFHVYIVLFTFLGHLVICSDPRSHYLRVLAPMWNTSLQIFV